MFISSSLRAGLRASSYILTATVIALCLLPVERAAGTVGTPGIFVTQNCSTSPVALCNSNPASITFSGSVSNSGNVTLTNVVLTDDLTGGPVLVLGTLAIGATETWSANFTVTPALCGRSNIVNTITATGGDLFFPASTATNRASCSFSVVCPFPSLTVTKACASPVVTNVGSSLTVTGQVCNTGLIDFTNVIVSDLQPGIPVSASNSLGSLAVGQCKPYSFTYTATSCDPNVDIVTALGRSICGNASANASATCFLCCPGISITNLVACLLPGATCPPSSASYGPTATGVKGNTGDPTQDNSAFCYIVVVRNTGQDPLTNIVIHDDKLGAIGTFPGPLAVGGTITISNLRTNWATTTTNTASVSAQCASSGFSPGNGAQVGASASAIANVETAAIACEKSYSIDGGPLTNNATIPNGLPHTVVWYLTITNAGNVNLLDLTITDVSTGPGCNVAYALHELDSGASITFPLCTNASFVCSSNNTGVTNTVTVVAHAFTLGFGTNQPPLCAVNITGSNITASTACEATLNCGQQCTVRADCIEGYNPSGKKIPAAGKNPSSGQNPDGYYQLLARGDCDPNPAVYVADTGSSFIAGPFASGDVIKLTQSPGKTPSQDPAPAPIVAHLHFKGDGLICAVDAGGNISEVKLCLVPRPPK